MPDISRRALAGLLLVLAAAACTVSASNESSPFPDFNQDPDRARIVADDLARFWRAWDLAEQDPASRRRIFQDEYLDAGTPGLQGFVEMRIEDVDRLLAAIDRHPRYYASLRSLTPAMAASAAPATDAYPKLHDLLPEAVFPDTYLTVGRMNTGGTVHSSGILIGTEMYGMARDTPLDELGPWHRAVLGSMDDLPIIIVHELIHVQQFNLADVSVDTLLAQCIVEGAADFLTELLMGRHINAHVHDWALPREAALWEEFQQVMHGGPQDEGSKAWLYNGGATDARPADLGYFIGYRIAQAYYEQAADPRAAIRDIVTATDFKAFLEASGYVQKMQRMAMRNGVRFTSAPADVTSGHP